MKVGNNKNPKTIFTKAKYKIKMLHAKSRRNRGSME